MLLQHFLPVQQVTSSARRCLPILVLGVAACANSAEGRSGQPSSPETPNALPSTTGGGVAGGLGSAPAAPGINCALGPQPGSSPIRRLTPFEYDNTVRDLLAIPTYPGAHLPVEGGAGYDNNAEVGAVSRLTAQKYMEGAEALSLLATSDLPALLNCDPGTGESTCVGAWLKTFGDRAWRRPLDTGDAQQMLELFSKVRSTLTLRESVQAVIEAFLESPHFLYRVEVGEMGAAVKFTDYQIASRLSYLLWGSMPDALLLEAASKAELGNSNNVAAQARRLLADPRAKAVMHHFHEQWWNYKDVPALVKDPVVYPMYSPEVGALFIQETNRFLDNQIFGADGSLAGLLTSTTTFVNPPLASFYGIAPPAGADFGALDEPTRRAGLLTQGAFLAAHAKPSETAIVARGVFIRGGLFCQVPPPPPANVNTQLPAVQQGLSTRARLEQHRADPACNACHAQFDPLGFAFEHYDGVGRWRDTDSGAAVDASGTLTGTDVDGPFGGISELASKAASSQLVAECAVTQWFRFAQGRQESAADICSLNQLNAAFKASGLKIPELVLALTQTDAFLYRNTTTGVP